MMVSGDGSTASSSSALVECVPNFSEGQRPDVMDAIQALGRVGGVLRVDGEADAGD